MTTIRVIIADRSAAVRSVLRRVLEGGGEIRVVGEAGDGTEAVDLVRRFTPDGLVTGLDTPGLSGRDYLEAVAENSRVPVLALIPTLRSESARIAFAAHDLGVIAVFLKPDTPDGWTELGEDLRTSILEVCGTVDIVHTRSAGADHEIPSIARALRFVAIGASTGGPGALCEVLRSVRGGVHVGIAVVQHIAAGFESILVEWLAAETGLDVAVARDGERLVPGLVRFAPADVHVHLAPDGTISLDREGPAVDGHKPSIEILFRSLLEHPPGTVAAVQLSGMGADGAEEMVRLRSEGVLTIAQDEQSCAVFGMPGAAIQKGAATFILAPVQIGRLLEHAAGTGR